MYLKKVEIAGFKSFATKTILDFLPDGSQGPLSGITAYCRAQWERKK